MITREQIVIESRSPQRPDEIVGVWPEADETAVDAAVDAARAAQGEWSARSAHERAAELIAAAGRVEADADALADLAVREVGKPVVEARGEVARVASTLRYYAQAALDTEGEVYPSADPDLLVFTRRRPRGVAALITPWNFPLALPGWKLAPALAYGNTVVLKPSRLALACAARLVEALALPEGVVTMVPAGPDAERLLPRHPGVDAVSFTGSTRVGTEVVAAATEAGAAAQAEMGGHNAAIVLPDVDIEAAASAIARGAMGYAGQKCTATKRVIVVGDSGPFAEALVAAVGALEVGDPADPRCTLGPVISARARETVLRAAARAAEQGGRLLVGGRALDREGWFVEPTVMADLEPGADLLVEEVFGPICAVLSARTGEEAVEIANATRFGMVAALYSRDLERVMMLSAGLNTGIVRVNAPTPGIDFNVPFGGVKDSGRGPGEQARAARELFTTATTFNIRPRA